MNASTPAAGAPRFSATDAAFAGFSLIRREPKAILAWALVRLLVNIALGSALVLLASDKILAFQDLTAAGSNASAEVLWTAVAGMLPFWALVIPINLGLQAVLYAAAYRAFLRPDERRLGYLRLGMDEVRLAVVTVLWGLIFSLLLFAALFVFITLVALADGIGGGLAILLGVLAVIAFVTVVVWSAVRMSLAWAVSFDQKRISLFSTWRLTQGHFWSVLSAYVLATILVVVVSLAAMAVFFIAAALVALATGAGIGSVAQVFSPDATSLVTYFTVGQLVYLAFEAVVSAACYAIVLGPTAEAYAVFGPGPADHAAA